MQINGGVILLPEFHQKSHKNPVDILFVFAASSVNVSLIFILYLKVVLCNIKFFFFINKKNIKSLCFDNLYFYGHYFISLTRICNQN